MRRLLRIRNARLFLLGDVVSTLGDSALWLALAIWMKELTGSSAWAGLVMFCYAVGNLFSPLGGAAADRFRRRRLLIWLNLAGAAVVPWLLLVHGRRQMWIVYAVVFLYGLIGSAIGPAQTALMPVLVPADLLAEMNGAQQTLNSGLRIITPLVGAGLFALAGAAVVVEADTATFGVAVVTLLLLRVTEHQPDRLPANARSGRRISAGFQFTDGFRFIAAEPALRTITISLALAMLAFGFTESAGFSVVTVGLHHKATFLGVLTSVQGGGAIAGGLTAAPLLRRVSEGMMTAMGLASAGIAVLLLTAPNLAVVLTGMLVAGLVGPWVSVAAVTAIQRRTPPELLGRVSGAFSLGLTVPQVTSVGVGAALIAAVNYQVLLLVIAVVAAAAVAYILSQPEARHRTTTQSPAGGSADVAAARL